MKKLLNFAELAEALNVPIYKAKDLHRTKKIPHVRLGHRTIRFDLEAVIAALQIPPATSRPDHQAKT